MKLRAICLVLAPMKTFSPISLLSCWIIWISCGLNNPAARCNSGEHSPFVLLWANSAGTQPIGPVPVTITLRAPRSCSLWYNWYHNINVTLYNFFYSEIKQQLIDHMQRKRPNEIIKWLIYPQNLLVFRYDISDIIR